MSKAQERRAVRSMLLAGLTATAVVMSAYAVADDAHHPEKTSAEQAAGSGSGMMMNGADMQRMQEKMRKMQMQMDEIRNTTDVKERDRLIDEHMQNMQAGMEMMRGMGGGMMQGMMQGMMAGGGMSSGGSMMGAGKPKSDDMMGRMDMMEKRMDMMQMMMEQMTQSRRAERTSFYGLKK